MAEPETADSRDDGFELDGEFYPNHVDLMHPKDQMLIDRITDMSLVRFAQLLEDPANHFRGPILIAIRACSIRAKQTDWTVERIMDIVTSRSTDDYVYINRGAEGQAIPPAEAGDKPAPTSNESSSGSSLSSTPAEISAATDATSSEIPRSSSNPGSRTGSQEPAALAT